MCYIQFIKNKSILDKYKSRENVQLSCTNCQVLFYRTKKCIQDGIRNGVSECFCSKKCADNQRSKIKLVSLHCDNCGVSVSRNKFVTEKSKSKRFFCSKSCAGTYNNKNKTHGTRRSKLEVWLEEQMTELYDFEIHFNRKDAIGSELDIYIPYLRLAFELNGIFHYEPIYGQDKLDQIGRNDTNKFQACQVENISLCIIDTSGQKRFTEKSSKKYLDIIKEIVEQNQ